MPSLPAHLLEVTVHASSKVSRKPLLGFLTELSKTDSTFTFRIDGPSGDLILQGMSEPHLQSTIEHVRRELKIPIIEGIPRIVYRSQPAIEGGTVTRLEPVMRVEVTTPSEYSAEITRDLRGRQGIFTGEIAHADGTMIIALVPLSKLFGYADILNSISQAKATVKLHLSHYGPTPATVLSKLGISFSTSSVINMRQFAAELPLHEENVLLWRIQRDSQGQLKIGLGAGHAPMHPAPTAIEDEVDGVVFYWSTKRSDLDLLCSSYSVYWETGQKMKVIPLATISDK